MRYAWALVILTALSLGACGGRSAPGLWWTTVNSNNANHNGNGNGNNNNNVPPTCGDGVLDPFEECDDGERNSDTRPDACRTNCRMARCGDDVLDTWEMCDRQNLGGLDCESMGYDGGTLFCTQWCELDESRCTWCGDGICGYGETFESCPVDCRAGCGDGWCSADEDPWTCPTDCGGVCGDGVCDPGEDPDLCPDDCGYCGDGYCGGWEDAWSCPEDCGWCGDGICTDYEDPWSCPQDCGWCGDGYCGPYEDSYSCPDDCGSICGDGWCGPGEDPWSCPQDCGTSVCGDGICGPNEDPWSCPADCRSMCGDGICDPWEDEWICPDDCGWCGDGICGGWEDQWSCPEDCTWCGDGYCGPYEDPWSCPQDCGGWCGDGYCGPGEDAYNCQVDCGWCGDGICGQGESTVNCPQDCGTGTGLSCQSIQMCAYCCSPASSCEGACVGEGSPGGQAEYSQLQACRLNACPQACANGVSWDCLMCSYQDCPDVCHYDAGGYDGCATVMSCTSGCGAIPTGQTPSQCTSDPAIQCWDSCWDQADQVAVVLYESLMRCLTTHCGAVCQPDSGDPACQSCLSTQCQYQLNACMSDY